MKLTHYIDGKVDKAYSNVKIKVEKNSKKYEFFLDNITNYIYITDRLIFIRESDDFRFELEINKKPSSTITIKKENQSFDIKVISANYKVNNKMISFNYKLETDEYDHRIDLEIGG